MTVEEHGPYVAVFLKHPSHDRMCGTSLIFMPHKMTAIYGDLSPGRRRQDNRGVIGPINLGTFLGATSKPYLAEKFLEDVFVPEHAATVAKEMADNERERLEEVDRDGDDFDDEQDEADHEGVAELDELAREALELSGEDDLEIASWLSRFYGQMDVSGEDVQGCYGPDPGSLQLLVAIQRRFSVLWSARELGRS